MQNIERQKTNHTESVSHMSDLTLREISEFRRRLLAWYEKAGRTTLPWQQPNTRRDPYKVWLAEIMLQQTQVATVIPYYQKFINRFPTISALANSDIDAVLHYWSGLGYYARARNLHTAARQIVTRHGGKFPHQFDHIIALPGIGRTTAGAILSFTWLQRHAILDGNVKRVLTRYYAIAAPPGRELERQLWSIATRLTPYKRVEDYNQAIMDLGATICTRTPHCDRCPVYRNCRARLTGRQHMLPRRKPKLTRPQRAIIMLVIGNARGEILLIKRPITGIWGGLWSLPEYQLSPKIFTQLAARPNRMDNKLAGTLKCWASEQFGLSITLLNYHPPFRHTFTHFDLDIIAQPARIVTLVDKSYAKIPTQTTTKTIDRLWYNHNNIPPIGLPKAVSRILAICR